MQAVALTPPRDYRDPSAGDVMYVLLLVQGAIGLLSGLAMLLFMHGNPLVWPVALGTPVLLFVLAGGVARNRRRSRRWASIIEWVILIGFMFSVLLSALPQLDFSFNLLTLITNVIVPVTLIKMLRRARAHDEAPDERDAARVGVVPETPGGDPVLAPAHGDRAITVPRRSDLVRTDWN